MALCHLLFTSYGLPDLTTRKNKILLLTHSADHFCPEKVADRLHALGYEPIRLNTDLHPTEWSYNLSIGENGTESWIGHGSDRISVQEIAGVWLRRAYPPKMTADMDPAYQESIIREASAVQKSLFHQLQGVPWIDQFTRPTGPTDKYTQLVKAEAAGLKVPATLITSDPAAVKQFYQQHAGNIITKMMTPISISMSGDGPSVYTSRVSEEDLADLDGLRLCPMTFQENIEKEYELRIAYVGGQCFAGKIDTTQTERGQTDWKRTEQAIPWQPYSLPEPVQQKLQVLMQSLELEFGAIDLIKEPNGDYVFLEVNISGEWGMLQMYLDYPIGEAIAERLHELIQNQKTP